MSRPIVFKTARFPDPAEQAFAAAFDIVAAADGPALAQLAALQPAPWALLCSIDVRLTAEAVAALPDSVRAVATYSVGTDHIDLEALRARGIALFNTPGTLADAVADAAIFLMLGAARRATESIALIRERRWTGWVPTQLIGLGLAGRKLGVMGMGAVGAEIAKRGRGFGMTIAYSDIAPSARAGEDAEFVADPTTLLAQSDVFVLACPSTPETRRFLNAERLAAAKPDLVVVNIGRGDLVDDDALVAALSSGRIFAAGLDVFDREPDLDPRYLDLPNAFLTPHIGSSTREARRRMADVLVDGLEAFRSGENLFNRVV